MTRDDLCLAVERALSPGCFFVPGGELTIEHRSRETMAWEIFRGHLLNHRQTRQRQEFETWKLSLRPEGGPTGQALLSIQLDAGEGLLYVTRSILVYGFEPYEAAPNVIESRETQIWNRELAGTVQIVRLSDGDQVWLRLSRCLSLAVGGASRLPITSIESPLPAFVLGQLAYFPWVSSASKRPLATPGELIEQALSSDATVIGRAQVLEALLRSSPADRIPQLAGQFIERWRAHGWPGGDLAAVGRTLFNHLALTPHTGLVDNLAAWLECLAADPVDGPDAAIDAAGYMLRHLVRHLTSFDLVSFHNLGADYPDALLLDRLLKLYLLLIDLYPDRFEQNGGGEQLLFRLRRRALRQAWLLRRLYEGHPVPDAPTSPGDNQRVLPAPWVRVPDEQLAQRARRRKTLFVGDPTDRLAGAAGRRVLERSIADLEADDELRELGMAVYLDRPLGLLKPPGEIDRTPLLSYEAFSRSIAAGRIANLERWGLIAGHCRQTLVARLAEAAPRVGVPVNSFHVPPRPGAVALEDALRAASDFIFLRTTRQSLDDLLSGYDCRPLQEQSPETHAWLAKARHVLLIRTPAPPDTSAAGVSLTAFDSQMQPRLELVVAGLESQAVRYHEAAGRDYLCPGLRCAVTAEGVCLLPPQT